MKTNYLVGIIVAIVALASATLAYIEGHNTTEVAVTTSPSGTTFQTAKTALVAINLASPGSGGTSTSMLNTDSNDRFIYSTDVGCEGVGTSKTAYTGTGLSSLTLTMATSSTAAPATNGNTNTLPVVTIGTSTPNFVIASSSAGTPGINLVSNIWATGSYLTITANATNTALCTAGVKYFGS